MKGLLLKDWYLTLKYSRSLWIIAGVFLFVSMVGGNDGNAFFRLYPCVMIGMLPMQVLTYDDAEKWTSYVQAFPVSREGFVTSKYLFGIMAIAAFLAVMTLLYLAFGAPGLKDAALFLLTFGVFLPSVMMPLVFRFGAEKGRVFYLIAIGTGAGLVSFLTVSMVSGAGLPRVISAVPDWAVCLASLALYAISWRLSVALYRRREL